MFKYFILPLICSVTLCQAQVLKVIPYPQKVIELQGYHSFNNSGFYTKNISLSPTLGFINQQLSRDGISTGKKQEQINIKIGEVNGYGAESYQLTITPQRISIIAPDTAGIKNGLVTLLQICLFSKTEHGSRQLPALIIRDQPRYAWRGVLLDESRHFFGKDAVEQLLDWMAFYKLNRFHWHLTDAHGWRIEIKKYPLLTTTGARGNYSDSSAQPKYYSQTEIREIVKYAAQRSITVIPEIDMPGHATAATRAYPELSGGTTPNYENFTFDPSKEKTYDFLNDVIREVSALFPGKMLHIGGDEVSYGVNAWKNNSGVSNLMSLNHLNGLSSVEHYFLVRIADSALKYNDKVLCWDEAVAANLPVNKTIVEWWRQDKPETLKAALVNGYQVVLCPRLPMYMDFVQDSTHISGRKWGKLYDSYLTIYHFPENLIAPDILNKDQVIGIQANLWSETVVSTARLQYLLFPRMASVAEAGWSAAGAKNDSLYNARLSAHLRLYTQKGICYYDPLNPALHPEEIDIIPTHRDE
jgi:hexosaminidase